MSDISRQVKLLRSQDPSRRYEACELLRVALAIPEEAVLALLELSAHDPREDVRDAANRALALHRPSLLPKPPLQPRPASSLAPSPVSVPVHVTAPDPPPPEPPTPASCPICRKDDMIQKIAAIRKAGITSGHYAGPSGGVAYVGGKWGGVGGYTTLSGVSSTQLAELLPPPRQPTKPRPPTPLGVFIAAVGGMLMTLFLCESGGNNSSGAVAGLVFGVALIAIGGIMATRSTAAAQPALDEKHARDMETYSAQVRAYERIYYCHRDDICFDPATGQYTPLLETWKLLPSDHVQQ